MAIHNLQNWIHLLIQKKDIVKISHTIDPKLEISEIVDAISKGKKIYINDSVYENPALYFSQLKNSKIPLAINLFGSIERIELALGRSIDSIQSEIQDLLKFKMPKNVFEGMKILPQLGKLFRYRPKTIKNPPCQEIVLQGDDIDLYQFPILQSWPNDAGLFITLSQTITKNLENDNLNFGMYRLQVINKQATAMHWHKHHDGASIFHMYKKLGKKMQVAVALGGPPSLIYASTAPLPPFIDELSFASFIMQDSIHLSQAKSLDLKIPSESEIILEGYIDPNEDFFLEGPFGDHTGYYSAADYFPIFHITTVTMRKNPIYPSILVGRPPMEDYYLGKLSEKIFLPLLKLFIPELVDIAFPEFGVFHNCVFVSIHKKYPFQAKKVMNAIWGLGQLMLSKFIIVVDANIDVQNTQEVLWQFANNVDPQRDILKVEGPLDQLDHSSSFPLGGSKMGFDATTRLKEEGHSVRLYPEIIQMSPNIKNKIQQIWHNLFESF